MKCIIENGRKIPQINEKANMNLLKENCGFHICKVLYES